MPLSEESDPSGKRQKQPCTGATTAAEKAGTTDAQRAAARPFFFLPALPGRSHCTACSSQRRPPALCQHTADRRALLHRLHTASHAAASTARRLAAPARSPPRPACFGADRWPAGPARLPDRRRAGAARPAAPPLAMTPRPPPGAGPMTTARPHRARRYWERRFNPLRVRKLHRVTRTKWWSIRNIASPCWSWVSPIRTIPITLITPDREEKHYV